MAMIAFTGGGSMGHVTPNLALIPELIGKGYDIIYIGSYNEKEKNVISDKEIRFFPIKTGKLRRYFDLKNITDIFNIAIGLVSSFRILLREKPDLLFSKGGFVAVPVVFSAYLLRIPVIIHESDVTIGLANRLCMPFTKHICYSFEETIKYIKGKTSTRTGIPIRKELTDGDKKTGKELCKFTSDKPVLLIIGGSQGSRKINNGIYDILDRLTADFNVCHLCGNDGKKNELDNMAGYKAFEYLDKEMKDIYSITDLIVSRAGATAMFEFLALKKPALLIPISAKNSRGDQILNAKQFEKEGICRVLQEEDITADVLYSEIKKTFKEADNIKKNMEKYEKGSANHEIIKVIEKYIKDKK